MIFSTDEFRARTSAAQALMAREGLAALLLTTEPAIRYFTGFLTRFWESPTRPWFLVLPASRDPIAVIPAIGGHLMGQSWITDIRTWAAPDYQDDGVSLLAETLAEVAPSGTIGLPSAMETHLRMPLRDWHCLQAQLPNHRFTGDGNILRSLRLVKSSAEISLIETACGIASRAFARVPEIAAPGLPLSRVCRDFQRLCLGEGADWVPYLATAAAAGGYPDVISPATETPLETGDVLMLDTGLTRQGYFCDFDRNFALGPPAPEVAAAHLRLVEATRAGFEAARPGTTAAALFHTMDKVLTGGGGGLAAGRLGHGLGMELTEWPSLIPADRTELRPGMVLTLEPSIEIAPGRMLVHEENIVIEETGARWLTQPAPAAMVIL